MRLKLSPPPTLCLMLGVTVVGANSLALSPILSDVASSLAATPVEIARANAAYGGATALSALVLGRLIDRFGAKSALVGGLIVLAAAMLISAAAWGPTSLATAQALAGASAGVMLPATYALAALVSRKGEEARTLGRVLSGWAISLVVGVPLSAFIAGASSWRVSYIVLAGLSMLAGLGVSSLPAGTATARDDVLWPLLRQSRISALLVVCFLFMTAFYGTYAYLGDHVRHRLGLDATQAGLVVLAYGLGFGMASMGDRMIDRIGADRLMPAVLGGLVLVYGAMIPATATLAGAVALAAVWGFVNHFGLNIIVLELIRSSRERRGAVLALNSATSYAGALVGAAACGVIYDRSGFADVAATAGGCLVVATTIAVALIAGVPRRA